MKACENVMDDYFKGHEIRADATLNPDTNRWTSRATVSWDEGETHRIVPLNGPVDYSQSKEDAERYAIALGRKWIDDGKPDLRR